MKFRATYACLTRCIYECMSGVGIFFCIAVQLSQGGCSSVKYMNVSRHKPVSAVFVVYCAFPVLIN